MQAVASRRSLYITVLCTVSCISAAEGWGRILRGRAPNGVQAALLGEYALDADHAPSLLGESGGPEVHCQSLNFRFIRSAPRPNDIDAGAILAICRHLSVGHHGVSVGLCLEGYLVQFQEVDDSLRCHSPGVLSEGIRI